MLLILDVEVGKAVNEKYQWWVVESSYLHILKDKIGHQIYKIINIVEVMLRKEN